MDTTRQKDILDKDRCSIPISIIGVGGIGSPVCLCLAKMGFDNITVYDFDTVESHNIPNQFHIPNNIGKLKVDSMKELTNQLTGCRIIPINNRITQDSNQLKGIVICAIDNMPERKIILEKSEYAQLFIDARMSAEKYSITTIQPRLSKHIDFFNEGFYTKGDQEPCTAKSIMYCPMAIAGDIGSIVKRFIMNQKYPNFIYRDLLLDKQILNYIGE